MKGDWYTEWLPLLLVASAIFTIFNGGWFLILTIWIAYLKGGKETVKRHPSKENEDELSMQIAIGVLVLVATGLIQLFA